MNRLLAAARPEMDGAVTKVLFGGPKSRTADHEALKAAKSMQAKGASREEILSATGWFQGPDSRWRYEIDDSKAKPSSAWEETEDGVRPRQPAEDVPFSDVFKHDEAFKAYPGVGRMAARVPKEPSLDMHGAYYPANRLFEISPHDDVGSLRGTALHEMQHAIDHTEGRPYGSLAFASDPKNRSISEVFARTVETRANLTPEERRARPPWLDYDTPEKQMVKSQGFGAFGPADPVTPRNRLLDLAAAPSAKDEPQGLMMPQRPAPEANFDVKQLMTAPLTTTQQRQMLEQLDPMLGKAFDDFNARLKKHYGHVPDEPTRLEYDLDPPDDAPADVKASAARLRSLLQRLERRPAR